MADRPDTISIAANGTLRLESVEAARSLAPHAGRYRLALGTPGLLVFSSSEPGAEGRARVLMAGEIVSRMTMMEVLNVIATAQWRGELTIVGPEARRTLALDQGALKHARSDADDDRLGQVLYRAGVLDRATLDELLARVTEQERLGQLLVRDGVLDQAQLFEHLRSQAEQIFYGALLVSSGSYIFTLPEQADTEAEAGTTVHIPIQGLLMEGVQRVDEMDLFRQRIPDDSAIPFKLPDAPEAKKLEAVHNKLLAAIDDRTNIETLARRTGLGIFSTVKGLYHLLQKKQIDLRADRHVDAARVQKLVSAFNEVMQDIFFAVATYGGVAQTRQTLQAWIDGSGYAPYFGPGIDEFGCVDGGAVADALAGVDADNPLAALHQALHEMAAFALFSATTTLPRDQELSLARDVNRRLEGIRIS